MAVFWWESSTTKIIGDKKPKIFKYDSKSKK